MSVDILAKATELLLSYPLCDYCLGRQFARLGYGLTNKQRGEALKITITMLMHSWIEEDKEVDKAKTIAENGALSNIKPILEKKLGEKLTRKKCILCGDQLSEERFRELAERICSELKTYEFKSFLTGAVVPPVIREAEDRIRAELSIATGEDIKNDITRGVGKRIAELTGAKVEYLNPDITILVDYFNSTFQLQVNPVFIYGVYLKHRRNIPQTIWFCRRCWGRGCSSCNYTGREYETSVSELVGIPAMDYFEALDYKFHAAGREDVDALVEGTGRPFVLELKHPRKRFLDLRKLEEIINNRSAGAVEVKELRYSSRRELRELKAMSPLASKTYIAEVIFDNPVDLGKLAEVEERFRNITIEQRTPTRVLRRRSDRVRHKLLHEVEVLEHQGNRVVFRIRTQGGLYVKELIDGDNGRTKPSIAELLNAKPEQILLSVVGVDNKPLQEQQLSSGVKEK